MEQTGYQDFGEQDFSFFKRKVKLSYGIDLDAYKRQQMERRIKANIDKCGAQSFTQYLALMQKDRKLLDEFIDRVTINVTEAFRNPDQFNVLVNRVMPDLLDRFPNMNIWSAGCSCGAETYTLAIIMDELAPNGRHNIIGTDIDDRMLARAERGIYYPHEVKAVSQERLRKYFDQLPDGNYQVKPVLKKNTRFRKQDMLRDRFGSDYSLILCRNVVIYFTDETKDRLYRRFYDSLADGGYLFVGGTERISEYKDMGFESRIPFFYRKPERH